jgi:hypothetical protein
MEDRKFRLAWSHENKGIRRIGFIQILLAIVTAIVGLGFLAVGEVRANAILAFIVAIFMFFTGLGSLIRKF